MKKALLSLLLLASMVQVNGQLSYQIGFGNSSNSSFSYPAAYGPWLPSAHQQFMIRASELRAAGAQSGTINSLSFDVSATIVDPNYFGMNNFEIKMTSTSDTELIGFASNLTTVFSSFIYKETQGWNTHPFSTGFAWNGIDNIVIDVCFDNGSDFFENARSRQNSTSYFSSAYEISFGGGPICNNPGFPSLEMLRPNMRLGFAPIAGLDLGATALLVPTTPTAPGYNGPIAIELSTFGTTPVTSATVGYQIDNNPPVTESWTGNLVNGSISHSFANNITLPSTGSPLIKLWATNANGLGNDLRPGNDTLYKTVCYALPAGTYTVGGSSADFFDLNEATDALACGGISGSVIFSIAPGVYTGCYELNNIIGSSTFSISFESSTGNPSDVELIENNPDLPIFLINNTPNVSFSGITFHRINILNASDMGSLQYVNSNTGSVSACIFIGFNNAFGDLSGIYLDRSSDIQIQFNEFVEGQFGIIAKGAVGNKSLSNIIMFNTFNDCVSSAIFVDYQEFVVIDQNQVNNIQDQFTFAFRVENSSNLIVSNNKINGVFDGAINLFNVDGDVTQPNLVFNNVITGSSALSNGLLVFNPNYLAGVDSLDHILFAHNTVNIDCSFTNVFGATGFIEIREFLFGSNSAISSAMIVDNNLSGYNVDTLGIADFRTIVINDIGSALNLTCDYNNSYFDAQSMPLFSLGGLDYATIADWQTVGFGNNDLNTNPFFASLTDPVPTSTLLNNKGTNVGISTDILGNTRNGLTPDIGAYEFDPPSIDINAITMLSPNSGCDLSAAEDLLIEVSNNGYLTYDAALNPLSITIDLNGAITSLTNNTLVLAPLQKVNLNLGTLNLSSLGAYAISVNLSTSLDSLLINNTITKEIQNISTINSFPYVEDFENGTGGWTHDGSNSSWEFGTPSGVIINGAASGTQAWVTSLNNEYNDNELSFIQSPCFDLSNLAAANVKMSIHWNTEDSYDGGNLQYSTDGGATWNLIGSQGSGLSNWYNSAAVSASQNNPVWANDPGSGGWVTAEHEINALAGTGGVIFRVYFYSDGSVTYEGIGIDDFSIYEPQNPIIDSVTVATSDCLPAARDIAAKISAKFSPVSTVQLHVDRTGSGVYTPYNMVFNALDTAYHFTIALGNKGQEICYYVTVVDNAGLSDQSETICYTDAYLNVFAGRDTSIFAGDSLVLNASSGSVGLLITEIMAFNGGSGTQTVFPAYATGSFSDFVELTNTASAPVNIGNLSVDVVDANGVIASKTFPPNTIVPASGIVLLAFGPGQDDPTNLLFSFGTANYDELFSGQDMGVVLRNSSGKIIDAVAKNAFVFSAGSGVSASDWSGVNNTSSGFAGIVRQGSDTNTSADWFITDPIVNITSSIGYVNAGLSLAPGNFTWSTGGTIIATTAKVTVRPLVNTIYIVTLNDGLCTVSDTIVVTVKAAVPDGGVSAIVAPAPGSIVSQSVPVTVRVTNYGRLPISNFDVVYTEDGMNPVTQTYLASLASGASVNFTFNQQWTPVGGNHRLCSYTVGIANDVNKTNDTTCINYRSNVGIEEINLNSIVANIYPIPANELLTFEFSEVSADMIMEISNALGQKVYVSSNFASKTSTINVSNMASGVYQYKVIRGKYIQTGKFVISR